MPAKDNLRARFLMTYAIFIAVTVLVITSVATAWQIVRTTGTFHAEQEQRLADIADTVEQEFTQLETYAINLSTTNWVQKLLYMQGGELDLERFDLIALRDYNQSLTSYFTANNFLSYFALACPPIDCVFFESQMIVPTDQFLSYTLQKESIPVMRELWAQYNSGTVLYPVSTFHPGVTREALLFLVSVPSIDLAPRAHAIYWINISQLAKLGGLYDPEAALIMRTPQGEVIRTGTQSIALPEDFSAYPDDSRGVIEINNKSYYYYAAGQGRHLSYTLLIPKSHLGSQTAEIVLFSLILYLLILSLGILFFSRWTQKAVKPIDDIFRMLRGNYLDNMQTRSWTGSGSDPSIDMIVQEMIEERQEIDLRMVEKNSEIAQYVLKKLLERADEDINAIEQELFDCGVSFPHRYFLAIVIRYRREGAGERAQAHQPIGAAVKEDVCHLVNYPDLDVLIINTAAESCAEVYTAYYRSIDSQENFYVAIGNRAQSLGALADSYANALRASNRKRLEPEENLFTAGDTKARKNHFYYPIDQEVSLINALKLGAYKEASALAEKLLSVNVTVMNSSPDGLINFFLNIYNSGVRAIRERGIDGDYDALVEKGTREILHCENIQEMLEYVTGFFERIAGEMSEHRIVRNDRLREDMEGYINERYSDPNLSLQSLADFLRLSVSHVSRVFGNLVGMSFLSYLNQTRVRSAMRLLKETELSVMEISRKVGYSNVVTFRRCFKAITGMTPQAFRE